MPQSRVYIFRGNCLLVPEPMQDHEALDGVDRETAGSAFGDLNYYAVPAAGLSPQASGDSPLCALLADDVTVPSRWRPLLVRQLLSVLAESPEGGNAGQLLRCYHIIQWRNDSVFCGSCGERNGDSKDELARLCPRCGRIEYPRISPAVIVLIIDDNDRILLAHNDKFKKNMYSLIAGFAEAGESLEAAINREIKEELDIDVTDIRYVKSQSWPFPNSLMIGFTARYTGGEIKPDGREISDARWFTRETIRQCAGGDSLFPELPMSGAISRLIINKWLEPDIDV